MTNALVTDTEDPRDFGDGVVRPNGVVFFDPGYKEARAAKRSKCILRAVFRR